MNPHYRLLLPCLMSAVAAGSEVHVGEGREHATIRAAIEAAATGDEIVVHPGIYQEGNIRVDKPVMLRGDGWPVLDGAGKHEVMTITAADVSVRGFEIRNSGVSALEDLAGVKLAGTRRAVVCGNRFRNCNFAVFLANAGDCLVEDNDIIGRPGGEQESGNGIHIWSCEKIRVLRNRVGSHRDGIYLEFATGSLIEHNVVKDNLRYGLHYMFSHDSAYRHNRFERNGAGVAVMYTRHVEMSSNHFVNNWGSSAYGLMLKDMTDGSITGNNFDRNSTGIAMHGSNRMKIENNRFSENGWAIQIQRSSSDNLYRRNNFSGNSFDIAADGELDNNRFQNNYWDKYEGYDLRRDGTGDVPFRPVSLYAVVVGRIPSSVLLLRSPVVHLLDQAEKAFPSITPERVADESPAMRPHPVPFHPEPKPVKKP